MNPSTFLNLGVQPLMYRYSVKYYIISIIIANIEPEHLCLRKNSMVVLSHDVLVYDDCTPPAYADRMHVLVFLLYSTLLQ